MLLGVLRMQGTHRGGSHMAGATLPGGCVLHKMTSYENGITIFTIVDLPIRRTPSLMSCTGSGGYRKPRHFARRCGCGWLSRNQATSRFAFGSKGRWMAWRSSRCCGMNGTSTAARHQHPDRCIKGRDDRLSGAASEAANFRDHLNQRRPAHLHGNFILPSQSQRKLSVAHP